MKLKKEWSVKQTQYLNHKPIPKKTAINFRFDIDKTQLGI